MANDLSASVRTPHRRVYNPAIFGMDSADSLKVHRHESHSSRLARFPSLVVIVIVVIVTVTVGGALV